MDDTPLVVVCLRPVDPRPSLDLGSGSISYDAGAAALAPCEAAALEHALEVAATWSGRVLAIAAGSGEAEPALREALALGASALRVDWPAPDAASLAIGEESLAVALAAGIRDVGEPALVLCGDRSADRGTGALPAFLAAELGAAQGLGLVALAPRNDPAAQQAGGPPPRRWVQAERRLEGGRREQLAIPLPAVCSIEAAGTRLRRAPLRAAVDAAAATIEVFVPPRAPLVPARYRLRVGAPKPYVAPPRVVAPPTGSAAERLVELAGVHGAHEPPVLVGPVGPVEAADELLAYLERQGYLS